MTCPQESTLDGAIIDDPRIESNPDLPQEDDLVRMTQDIPELSLRRGDVGVVRCRWLAPVVAYEVEFHLFGAEYASRGLMVAGQIELAERRRRAPISVALISHAPRVSADPIDVEAMSAH